MISYIKKILAFIPIAAVLTAVNGAIFYTSVCSGEIIQSHDIYGGYYSAEKRSVNNRERLISALNGIYETDIEQLNAEIEKLSEYKQAADYIVNNRYVTEGAIHSLPPEERREFAEQLYNDAAAQFGLSEDKLIEHLNSQINDLRTVTEYIEYLDGYQKYVTDISEQSDFLADISIYSGNDSAISNIIKTKKDFYGLADIPLTPVTGDGFITFLNFRPTDLIAVLTAILIALTSIKGGKKSLLTSVLFIALSTSSMYLCNIFLTDIFIGLPTPEVSLQSMNYFKSCPYMINVGTLTIGFISGKIIGAVIVLFSAVMIISSRGKKRIITAAVLITFFAAEILFSTDIISSHFLQEINILSCFSFERFFIRYLNLDIFGITVSRLPVFIFFIAFTAGLTFFFALKSVTARNMLIIKESEQHYYDEINRRYQESRKIRHDINNHLLAINMLIESGNIERAKKYISEVSEQTDLAAMPVKTGSDVLDALLFKKTEQAYEQQISLLFEVSCPLSECGISDYDLCTVFGNIIDNALEAAEKNDPVTVTIGSQMDMLYISCENPFRGTLKRRGDRILTTKTNPLSHGFGIGRVREIARRYNGDVQITDGDGKFRIEILMNLKNKIN